MTTWNHNYSKLRAKIKEIFGNESVFADKMGISKAQLSAKLNSKVVFKQPEIYKAVELLNLTEKELKIFFF